MRRPEQRGRGGRVGEPRAQAHPDELQPTELFKQERDQPTTPESISGELDDCGDSERSMRTGMQFIVDGQRKLERQAEQLAKRVSASSEIVEGQRRLQRQLDMLSKQMSPPPSAQRNKPKGARPTPRTEESNRRADSAVREVYGDWSVPDSSREGSRRDARSDTAFSDEEDGRRKQQARRDCKDSEYSDYSDDDHRGRRAWDDVHEEGPMHHDKDGQHHVEGRPSIRSARKFLSWRREDTLSRLHGDSPIYYAAWMAEWVTCGLFTAANLVMLVLWARHDGNQDSYVTTLFVTAIAAATYFAKACHMGDFTINGIVVPLPRYIDWITTTPLMLYEICHIAHASFGSTFMVILCDILMIATGMIEAMIPWKPHKGIKQIWFLMSCWFFVLMLLVIHFDVAKKAEKQNEVAQGLFKQLEVLTIVVWSLYPLIVGIGRANTALITKPMEDIALCFMDVVAKIGMEGLIVAACYSGCLDKTGGH